MNKKVVRMLLTRPRRIQTGKGIGSILRGISRIIKPIISSPAVKSAAKNIAKKALASSVEAGSEVVKDALRGENIVDSLKRNVVSQGDQVLQHAMEEVGLKKTASTPSKRKITKRASTSSGYKRKRKKHKSKKDIFS